MGTLKGKNLLPEGVNSFLKEQFLMAWKSLLPQLVTSLECYFFITYVSNCVMVATPMPAMLQGLANNFAYIKFSYCTIY